MQPSSQRAEVPSDVKQAIDMLQADLVGKPVRCDSTGPDDFFTVDQVKSGGQRKICFTGKLHKTGKPFSATYELTPEGVLQGPGGPRAS